MPKIRTVYTCQNCAYQTSNWVGQCPSCKEWNTFIEDVVMDSPKTKTGHRAGSGSGMSSITPIKLADVISVPTQRLSTSIAEFDRVLGGGFVPGQVVLLAGEPGIGKSTLLTEISRSLGDNNLLYIAGEESVEQIKIRAQRMGYDAKNLYMLAETNVESIVSAIETEVNAESNIKLVIIDSVQTIYMDEVTGVAGSLTQVRGGTQILTAVAKRLGIPLVLVGHVTKEGVVAGPKVLEHIVDTVLYLEGDSQHMYRLLRTSKNRFGPVSEVGIFEMAEQGMKEITNPSELFLEQRMEGASGSCVTIVMEGYRPILFEVQALTVKTSFGYPRRTASGFNANRLQVLIATLEKRAGLNLSGHDVYLNIAGGFKVSEYAADLAVCLAIVSALKDIPIKKRTAVFGEVGLNGEIRNVTHQSKRIAEAKKLGYTNVISPDKYRDLVAVVKTALEK